MLLTASLTPLPSMLLSVFWTGLHVLVGCYALPRAIRCHLSRGPNPSGNPASKRERHRNEIPGTGRRLRQRYLCLSARARPGLPLPARLHSVALFCLRFRVIRHVGPHSRTLFTVLKTLPPSACSDSHRGALLLCSQGLALSWHCKAARSRGAATFITVIPPRRHVPVRPTLPGALLFGYYCVPCSASADVRICTFSPRSALRCAVLHLSRGAAQLAGGKWV